MSDGTDDANPGVSHEEVCCTLQLGQRMQDDVLMHENDDGVVRHARRMVKRRTRRREFAVPVVHRQEFSLRSIAEPSRHGSRQTVLEHIRIVEDTDDRDRCSRSG